MSTTVLFFCFYFKEKKIITFKAMLYIFLLFKQNVFFLMVLLAYCCVAQCLAIWLIMENWLFISVSIVIANSVALFLPLTLKKTFILHLPTKGAELHLKTIKKNIIDAKCSNTQIGRMHKNSAQSSTPCRKYVFSVKLELRMGLSFKKLLYFSRARWNPGISRLLYHQRRQ